MLLFTKLVKYLKVLSANPMPRQQVYSNKRNTKLFSINYCLNQMSFLSCAVQLIFDEIMEFQEKYLEQRQGHIHEETNLF